MLPAANFLKLTNQTLIFRNTILYMFAFLFCLVNFEIIICSIVNLLLLISIFSSNRENKNENQDDSIWLKEKWSIGEV